MKKAIITKTFLCLMLLVSFNALAQLNIPRGSQQATVSQRVGITDISVTYSRPSVNGREVWGKLVPYGLNNLGFGTSKAAPWRAGANENTTITFTHDTKVEGKPIKAGTYGLHFIVKENGGATLILSNYTNAWGSFFYDDNKDALRADIKTKAIPHKELLTFEFDEVSATSTTASLLWEKRAFPFKVEVDVTTIVIDEFKASAKGQTGFQRQNWENMARFSLNNEGD